MASSRFEYLIYIRTSAAELWRGVSAPGMTRQDLCGTWQDCDWKVDASWRLMTPDGRVGDAGEVLEIEPEKRVVLSWRHELMAEFRAEGFSRCAILLEPHEGAMKLSLTHEIENSNSKLIAAF